MNMKSVYLIITLLIVIAVPLVLADRMNLNSGGSRNMIINPTQLDGFFGGNTTAVIGDCNPILNEVWNISTTIICDGVVETTGTGVTNILSGGELYLINGANITTNKLNLLATSIQIVIETNSKIII